MAVRQLVAVTIAVVCSLGTSAGQEDPVLPAISNWSAPPYWSPALDGKVAKAPPGSPGSLGAEAVEVLPSPPMPFVAVNPCRIADTRGNGFSGQAGPPALLSNATRTFQIGGTVVGVPTQCGIPLTAQAVSFQFTVIQPSSAGNLIAWPSGPTPTISVLNWEAGIFAIGNGIVVPVSDTGGINVFVNAPFGASAQLTIDVNGYYAPVGIVNTLNGLSGAVTLSAGSNVTITPAGNTLTIAATGSAANWSLTGNSGTTPGTNFLGTTDNQSLVIKVNNQRVLQLVPSISPSGGPSVIGGHSSNFAFPDAATISGGGYSGFPNLVTDPGGTVGGGANNQAGDGLSGFPFTEYATVSGGYGNTASGLGATVPGGSLNTAQGKYSFAAGYRAKALNDGSFVWADSNDLDFEPPMALGFANSFHVRATGGAYFVSGLLPTTGVVLNPGSGSWSSLSDTAGKENFRIVDGHDVLARLADVRIQTWNYKTQPSTTRHIGPMAQDFRRAFEVGEDERYISTVDADGVALAAIQAVYEIVKQRDGEIAELKARLSKLEASRK